MLEVSYFHAFAFLYVTLISLWRNKHANIRTAISGASTPLKQGRSMRTGKNDGGKKIMYTVMKMRGKTGRKIKGKRDIKLLKHIFALYSRVLTFAKKFSRSLSSLDYISSSN